MDAILNTTLACSLDREMRAMITKLCITSEWTDLGWKKKQEKQQSIKTDVSMRPGH
jgi:hypothetical protein